MNMPVDKDVEENKVMAAISYLCILFLIPLLMAKESKFAQFHAKQGMVLCIFWVAIGMFTMVPVVGWMFGWVLHLIALIASIIGFLAAIQGRWYKMPVVSELAEKIKI